MSGERHQPPSGVSGGAGGVLAERAEAGLTFGTLDGYCSGMAHRHHQEGLSDLTASKTDQEPRGQLVGVARGDNRLTDPIRALDDWVRVRPSEPGALFTRVFWRHHPTTERIGPRAISRTVQERSNAAGFDGIPVSGHSLRAGHATTAAVNGAPIDRIAAQTRHRDLGTLLNDCIRPAEAMATTTSRDLGL